MSRRARALAVVALVPLAAAAGSGVSRRKVALPDGFAIALYRYAPEGPGAGRPAVLLVPDLPFTREVYDVEGTGLARYLAAHGRETFVVELRGQGQAQVAAPWRLQDWVAVDLPAAVAAVQAAHPGPVDLVVQGYSGALALGAAAVELDRQVDRVVAISPAVWPDVPNPGVRELLARGGRFASLALDARAFELVFAAGGDFPSGRLARLRASAQDLSPAAARELLGWMESGDLPLPGGTTLRGRLGRYARPTLLVLPLLDNFAHPEFASPLRDLAPRAPITARLLSRWELFHEDYTHLSVLAGAQAPAEVWAPALRFLDESGAPVAASARGDAP